MTGTEAECECEGRPELLFRGTSRGVSPELTREGRNTGLGLGLWLGMGSGLVFLASKGR